MAVSWGPQVALAFLHRMTQDWKDQHIAWFVAESPVWSGTPSTAGAVTAGYTPNNNSLVAKINRACATAVPSPVNLLPRKGTTNVTWDYQTVIVKTPSKTYTAYDMPQLYEDLGFDLADMVRHIEALPDLATFAPPGVNTLITYGYNLSTAASYEWDEDFVANSNITPPQPSVVHYDPQTGDGLVPLRSSLRAMQEWTAPMAASGHKLVHKSYVNQRHASCMLPRPYENTGCFEDVISLLLQETE
eukprot:TRINITY_DN10346_c0_g1_i1.p1 TRINITY_DN10346_c0_g1~~TRINITY_DN10346_c0_g1_i1.p1  ORF type:complete len:245 (+),score=55.03 TRINITY_DN10346_c0_g1_i1:836-1570(+)